MSPYRGKKERVDGKPKEERKKERVDGKPKEEWIKDVTEMWKARGRWNPHNAEKSGISSPAKRSIIKKPRPHTPKNIFTEKELERITKINKKIENKSVFDNLPFSQNKISKDEKNFLKESQIRLIEMERKNRAREIQLRTLENNKNKRREEARKRAQAQTQLRLLQENQRMDENLQQMLKQQKKLSMRFIEKLRQDARSNRMHLSARKKPKEPRKEKKKHDKKIVKIEDRKKPRKTPERGPKRPKSELVVKKYPKPGIFDAIDNFLEDLLKTGVEKRLDDIKSGKFPLTITTTEMVNGIFPELGKNRKEKEEAVTFILDFSLIVLTAGTSSLLRAAFGEALVSKAPFLKGIVKKSIGSAIDAILKTFAKATIEELAKDKSIDWAKIGKEGGKKGLSKFVQKIISSAFFNNMKIDLEKLEPEANTTGRKILLYAGEKGIAKCEKKMNEIIKDMIEDDDQKKKEKTKLGTRKIP